MAESKTLLTDSADSEHAASKAPAPELISFKRFLESIPTGQGIDVSEVWFQYQRPNARLRYETLTPELELNCTNSKCDGYRVFRSETTILLDSKSSTSGFIDFVCSNCKQEHKRYSLLIKMLKEPGIETGIAHCYKYGEFPPFGDPTPARLLKLAGSDRTLFLKGRQCENHGLGIGAFSYYRRVVEDQKNRILEAIINAAIKLSAPDDMVESLNSAKEESQFKPALESVKNAVPPGLLINGSNPLTLLHSALSDGLHARTDEECLQFAHDIRLVLDALSERLAQAVKDEKELNAAIGRLTQRK